jgi:heme/copper-type cytochrome/quinol oxidase subunit 3
MAELVHMTPGLTNRDVDDARARRESANALLGMVIFVASWAILFAGLFFSYGVIRVRAVAWPPADLPALPTTTPGLATLVIGLSSLALQLALDRVRTGAGRTSVVRGALAAALLGATFLALQLVVWRQMWQAGLRPQTGTYASVFYALTAFHALHVAVGLLALAWIAIRGALGAYTARSHVPLRLWTVYWHMVGVIWAIMYVLVYVV